jgi:hypothetical protein
MEPEREMKVPVMVQAVEELLDNQMERNQKPGEVLEMVVPAAEVEVVPAAAAVVAVAADLSRPTDHLKVVMDEW